MDNFLNKKISKFNSFYDHKSEVIDIRDELKNIEAGLVKDIILKCRYYLDNDDLLNYNVWKKKLPAVTFSGTFSSVRRSSNLDLYSQIIVLDIDYVDVNSTKNLLKNDEFVFAMWISPSNKGLKCLVKLSCSINSHKLCFKELCKYFYTNYAIRIDMSGSDTSRLCFTSYDPDLYLNENSVQFSEPFFELPIEYLAKDYTSRPINNTLDVSLRERYYKTEGRNIVDERRIIVKIIKYLRKNKLSITSDYEDWLKVGFAIANSFTYSVGEKYFIELSSLDEGKFNYDKAVLFIKECYSSRNINKVTLSTIIFFAKQKGFPVK